MACKKCGQTFPIIRKGLPTIYAFGPFPGWEDVDYTDLENDGTIQAERKDSDSAE